MVDGAENNLPSFYSSKHYEVCKYFSVNEHSSVPDILVISTLIWNDLNETERKWLMDAVRDATVFQRKLWKEAEEESLAEIIKAGVKVNYPIKENFEIKANAMVDALKEKDEELYKLITEIKKVR